MGSHITERDENPIDPVTGERERSVVEAHRFRVLGPEERVRSSDVLLAPHLGPGLARPQARGARLAFRKVRIESGVYRFIDAGELVCAGDEWRDAGGRWRPVWSVIGAIVVNGRHLRRRVDGLVEHRADIRPAVGRDLDLVIREIDMELGTGLGDPI